MELRKSRGMDLQYGLREGDSISQFGWNRSTHARYIYVCVFSSIQLLWPHRLHTSRLLCPWDFPGKNIGVGCQFPSLEDLPDPGINPVSPALADGFFPTEPPGKPIIYPHVIVNNTPFHSPNCHCVNNKLYGFST